MSNIFAKINQGYYPIYNGLNLVIENDLLFEIGNYYYLKGDNGAGKSTFLKKVFLDSLNKYSKNKYQYLYLSQDIISQYYLVKSYFGYSKSKKIKDIESMINEICRLHVSNQIYDNTNLILIFDEVDKFLNVSNLIDTLKRDITLVFVSHHSFSDFKKNNKILNFKRLNDEDINAKFL